jgi:hypothetical protein
LNQAKGLIGLSVEQICIVGCLIADVSALNGGVKKFKAWCVAVVYEGAITVHARRIEFVVSQANRHVDILIQ